MENKINRHIHLLGFCLCLLAVTVGSGESYADDWIGFRGPTGMGIVAKSELALEWGADKNLVWKTPLPPTVTQGIADHNQSSPIVVGKHVIVTTAHWPMGSETRGILPEHRVSAFDLTSGTKSWSMTVKPGAWALTDLRGGYAATTPTPLTLRPTLSKTDSST